VNKLDIDDIKELSDITELIMEMRNILIQFNGGNIKQFENQLFLSI